MPKRLLIIEETASPLKSLDELQAMVPSVSCQRVGWRSSLPALIRDCNPDLVLFVAVPGVPHGINFLQFARDNQIVAPTLAIIPDDGNSELVRLASHVFDDFVIAPVRSDELRHRIMRLLGEEVGSAPPVHERLAQELALMGLIGEDPVFLNVIGKIPLAARSKSLVLIVGETGTGKELCARAIHSLGPRRDFPFIAVDCATLPDHLFENELFGHTRGAFTDAGRDQKGLVALAEGGTLFLDEIDSLSLSAQSKLLRFLQEHSYRPLGSDRFVHANVKLVVATNNNLEELVRKKAFRADLFFRLNVLQLYLPPLRERRGDIALLARHFLKTLCAENEITKATFPLATLRRLTQYDWPGNVRELYNVIQRAVIFSEGAQILVSHLDGMPGYSPEPGVGGFREARSRAIESFERRYVEDLMRECNGNVSRAARIAQKDRRAFGRLVKRYKISRESC